jgi:hypothetical protein
MQDKKRLFSLRGNSAAGSGRLGFDNKLKNVYHCGMTGLAVISNLTPVNGVSAFKK